MIVSDSHRFICFQPWKCASSTLYKRLRSYDSGRYAQPRYFNEILGAHAHKHMTLHEFMRLPESRQDYYRFCFVRNPYDRVYSGFMQRKHRLTTDRELVRRSKTRAAELRFIEKGFVPFVRFLSEEHAENGTTVVGYFLHEHTHYENQPELDFIGFIETFESCFDDVCRTLGIEPECSSANVRILSSADSSNRLAAAIHRYLHEFDAGPTRRSTTGRRTRRTLTTGLTRARGYGRSPVSPM